MKRKSLKFIDLFAGIGGFHYALKDLGHKCVLASEIQKDLKEIYQKNHPDISSKKIIGDIHTEIKVKDIPNFDILCAGFPCQPFSQAGYRMGLNDPNNGNHFLKILEIIKYHKPSFIFLENVPNLKGHDNGNTWNVIRSSMEIEGYIVDEKILSPDQFGVPQQRKRIYIVGVHKSKTKESKINYPNIQKESINNLNEFLQKGPVEDIKLKSKTLKHILHWESFVKNVKNMGDQIPRFPIWSMEFGATYPFLEKATKHHKLSEINRKKGKFGISINASSVEDLEYYLPKYSLSSQDIFPKWKINYIKNNRIFFEKHKNWIKNWKKEIFDWKLSHQKFEWNCGNDVNYTLKDKIIQFRPSGIRVKNRDRFPALVLSSTQIPIIFDEHRIGGPGYRYITKREAANLQSMPKENFKILENNLAAYKSFGNAVNVKVVREVVKSVLKNCNFN